MRGRTAGKPKGGQTCTLQLREDSGLRSLRTALVPNCRAEKLPGDKDDKRCKSHRALRMTDIVSVASGLGLAGQKVRIGLRGDATPPRKRGGAAPEWLPQSGQRVARDDDWKTFDGSKGLGFREIPQSDLRREPNRGEQLRLNVRSNGYNKFPLLREQWTIQNSIITPK